MVTVMSKLLILGMPLEEVVERHQSGIESGECQ